MLSPSNIPEESQFKIFVEVIVICKFKILTCLDVSFIREPS